MLFRKKHPRACIYCRHCANVDNERILCIKCGIVSADHSCRRFSYDPCKRVPPKPKSPDFDKYNEDDFSL